MPESRWKSWNTPTAASRYAIRAKSSPAGRRRRDPVCCEPLTGPWLPLLNNCWLSLSPLLTLAASNSWMRVMLLVYGSLDATACAGRPFEPWGGTATTLWHLILVR